MTCPTRMRAIFARLLLVLLVVAAVAPARAQETVTYTYDAMGRLVSVAHGATGPNANVSSAYTYDPANNRTKVVVNAPIRLTLTAPPLASGTVGVSYSQTITANGGTAPYTYTSSAGLPNGLSLSSTGILSGTPTTAGTYTFTVTATDSASDTGSQAYTVTINGVAIALSPTSLSSGTVGVSYSQTLSASGGTAPYSYAVTSGALPGGVTLSSAGALSGSPSTAGTYNFTVTATDSASNSGSQAYSLTIKSITVSPTTLSNGMVGTAYSKTITAVGGTGSYSFALTSGTLPAGLTLSSGGALSGTPTTAATYSFTVTATDTASNTGSQSYTVKILTGTINLSPALPIGTKNVPYSFTFAATGGVPPYTYTIGPFDSLPTGLRLSSTGVLSGTPTLQGRTAFTLTATDSASNSGSQSYTMIIGLGGLTLSPTTLPNGTTGTRYSQTITATGGRGTYAYELSFGTLPPGLSLSSTGLLSGILTTSGTYNFTIAAADAGYDTGTQAYSVVIGP